MGLYPRTLLCGLLLTTPSMAALVATRLHPHVSVRTVLGRARLGREHKPFTTVTSSLLRVIFFRRGSPDSKSLVFNCRTTSASTAPCTSRGLCCLTHCAALRIVIITVPHVSRSCEHFPDGFDLHHLSPASPEEVVTSFYPNVSVFRSESPDAHSSYRDLSGRLKFTVRRHKFNNDSHSPDEDQPPKLVPPGLALLRV